MTADIAAAVIVKPISQIIADAKQFLASGIELANSHEFEKAIAHFTPAIRLSLLILEDVQLSPTTNQWLLGGSKVSIAQLGRVEVTAIQSFYHRGCALCKIEKYEAAIADFSHLIHQPPTSSAIPSDWLITKLTEIYIHRGNAYRRLGDYPQALADLDRSVARASSAQSYSCRGLVYLDTDEFEKAIADFSQALLLHPTFAQGYLWRGFARVRSGEYGLAIEDLDRAIAAIPNCAEAFNYRGLAYFHLGDLAQAHADFSQAIQIGSTFAEAYNNRANVLQLLGDTTAAEVDYGRAISLAPQQTAFYLNRMASNHSDDLAVLENLEIIENTEIANASFYRCRAAKRVSVGDIDGAVADYTTALDKVPTADAFYQRGKLYQQKGELEGALSDFTAAIEQSPEYGKVYCDRAQLRFKMNDAAGALSDFQYADELSVDLSNEMLITRCLTYFSIEDKQRAIDDFERLVQQIQASSQSSSQTSKDSTSMGSDGG